jgi:hypothetical protein
MRRSAAALWAAFVLGAWQLASVALLGTSPTAAVVIALAGGLAILVVAAWGAVTGAAWSVWLVILFGAAFAVAPFVAGFADESAYVASYLITGVLLILLGVVAAVDIRQAARSTDGQAEARTVASPGPADTRRTEDDDLLFGDEPLVRPREPDAAGDDLAPGGPDDERRRAA